MQKNALYYFFLKPAFNLLKKPQIKRKYEPKILCIYIKIIQKNLFVKWFYCLFKVIPLRVGRIVSLKFRSFIPGPFILILFILLT